MDLLYFCFYVSFDLFSRVIFVSGVFGCRSFGLQLFKSHISSSNRAIPKIGILTQVVVVKDTC